MRGRGIVSLTHKYISACVYAFWVRADLTDGRRGFTTIVLRRRLLREAKDARLEVPSRSIFETGKHVTRILERSARMQT
jgi:hypothetical protein